MKSWLWIQKILSTTNKQEERTPMEDMLRKISTYSEIMHDFGFRPNGQGKKPWTVRNTHPDGRHVDIRNTDWTCYPTEDTGNNPESLLLFLKGADNESIEPAETSIISDRDVD
jgi:hypothetical protein